VPVAEAFKSAMAEALEATSFFSLYFFLDKKVPKSQDCACLAQKTYVQKAKTPKLAASQLKQWVFFNAFLSCFLAHQTRSVCTTNHQSLFTI